MFEYFVKIWWKICVLLVIFSRSVTSQASPHILFIMVDDMGWNDVSYHGSNQILTPNLDVLASRGVILQQYYSEAICTPARTALLTGKYPMRLGMHGMPLYNSEDRGIPVSERLLPSYLKERGYKTHLVGKWHVGMSRNQFLPTRRGYDSHYGMLGGFVDYYTYNKVELLPNGKEFYGADLTDNDIPQDDEDRYIVDALTERAIDIIQNHNDSSPMFLHLAHNVPHAGNDGGLLQPPNVPLSKRNQHIAHSNRRLYAEMVTHLDLSVGKVVKALADNGMLQNTIIIFASDNGAPTVGMFNNWGVNLPFRGKKQTPWEGGVRVPAFIWHPSLRPKVWDGLMHVTDWLPTLVGAVGGEVNVQIDGVNQWDSISKDAKPKRKEVLIAIEDSDTNIYAAFRAGDYKIVVGNVTGLSNGYYGADFMTYRACPPDYFTTLKSSEVAKVFESFNMKLDYDEVLAMREASIIKQTDPVRDLIPCEPSPERGCLYNVKRDPSESHDLWSRGTKITDLLWSRLKNLWSMQLRRGPVTIDPRADPANFGYRWMPWLNDSLPANTLNNTNSSKNEIASNLSEKYYIVPNSDGSSDGKTVTTTVNCQDVKGFRNFLCILRSVF
ncbi:arylsulfatase B-like isoform X1 [Danaus plexippus]|uniref:arylsulfatase B-like isoform X1 n=1 Tax=Danaus plexippus TaxID=13037 RepID=UPI002AB19732|nr:arylsulfatase B-like isoform X1 [Danaus plexippus]